MNSPDIPDGTMTITENPDRRGERWYLIAIGRARYVKRFNLSEPEARELIRQLTGRLP